MDHEFGIHGGERTLSDVLNDIVSHLQKIVRSELKLAKIELSESARQARSSAILLASGAVLGFFALGFLFLTVMFALELVLPNWLAALLVGIALLIATAIGIASGRARLKAIRAPRATIQTIKEDVEWMSEQQKS